MVTCNVPVSRFFKFLVNRKFKALVTGLPKNLLVEPGILGKNKEVSQELPGEVRTSWLTFPTNLLKTFKIYRLTIVIVPTLPGTS